VGDNDSAGTGAAATEEAARRAAAVEAAFRAKAVAQGLSADEAAAVVGAVVRSYLDELAGRSVPRAASVCPQCGCEPLFTGTGPYFCPGVICPIVMW
jgi:hypothetical protein